jgi:hypothetical protein
VSGEFSIPGCFCQYISTQWAFWFDLDHYNTEFINPTFARAFHRLPNCMLQARSGDGQAVWQKSIKRFSGAETKQGRFIL